MYIYSNPTNNLQVEVFNSLAERPMYLRTRREWQSSGRKVLDKMQPVALVNIRPTSEPVGLFAAHQTREYHPTPRTRAFEDFWATFIRDHNHGIFIYRSHDDTQWFTAGSEEQPEFLSRHNLREHIREKEVFGVRGGSQTRFGAIDLDLHAGCKKVFLAMLKVLLVAFHGKESWHVSVSATGVHIINVFKKMPLAIWRYRMRKVLRSLDATHFELVKEARLQSMKSFADLELYPDTTRGFRLPLARYRTVLLDKPLTTVLQRETKEQDVLGYMAWIQQAKKAVMPVDEVLAFVNERIQEKPGRQPKKGAETQKTIQKSGVGSDLLYIHPIWGSDSVKQGKSLKGRFAKELVNFWTGKKSLIGNVHQAIILTSRMLPYEVEQEEAIELLHQYVDDLPELNSKSATDPKKLALEISSRLQKVYSSNGWQTNTEASNAKLQRTAQAWHKKGFFISRKETWLSYRPIPLEFTPQEELVIKHYFPDLLKCEASTAVAAIKRFLSFVDLFGYNQIPMTALPTILKDIDIKWGAHDGKAGKFIKALVQLDWLGHSAHRWVLRGKKGKGQARRYWIGTAMQHHFSDMGAVVCA